LPSKSFDFILVSRFSLAGSPNLFGFAAVSITRAAPLYSQGKFSKTTARSIANNLNRSHARKEVFIAMSLVTCPSCRAKVSVAATACPKCGQPFSEGELDVRQAAVNKAKAELDAILNKRNPAGRAIGLVLGAGGVVTGGIMCLTGVGVICGLPVLLIGVVLLFSSLQGSKGGNDGTSSPDSLKDNCPYCGRLLTVGKDSYRVKCPACDKSITVWDGKFYRVV
jgi:predicted RNA-binding Zn-ribbon protein involved in translation (DUF1610 family)